MNRIEASISREWSDNVTVEYSKPEPDVGWHGGYEMYGTPMEIELEFVPEEHEIEDFYKFSFEPSGKYIEASVEVEVEWREPNLIRIVKIWSEEFHEPA
jgi:hypothetical protein